jgi:hypothetical protein
MAEFYLTDKQIQANWKTFREIVNEISPRRKDAMNRMYDELDERVAMAPASSYEYFHNAIPGGYVDHVLRVYNNALKQYELWKSSGMIVDNFTLEELSFAAIHHDIGKCGMPGENGCLYQTNKSEWHRKNQGKMYQTNPDLMFMDHADRGFYLLNYYGIQYSANEMLGMKLADGMYSDHNKPYLVSYDLDKKLRNNIGLILHHADLMAARFEFERWATTSEKFQLYDNKVHKQPAQEPAVGGGSAANKKHLDIFAKVFAEMEKEKG